MLKQHLPAEGSAGICVSLDGLPGSRSRPIWDNCLIFLVSALSVKKATQPCPCGWLGDLSGRCHCTPDQIQRYHARISGPLLDRIDIHVEVPALDPKYFQAEKIEGGESSQVVRERVAAGHEFQLNRAGKLNCDLGPREVDRDCKLNRADRELLKKAAEKFGLSARAWHRVLRVARTIADLGGVKSIRDRTPDRGDWLSEPGFDGYLPIPRAGMLTTRPVLGEARSDRNRATGRLFRKMSPRPWPCRGCFLGRIQRLARRALYPLLAQLLCVTPQMP